MLDFLRTNVGFLGQMLDKCLTRTKLRQILDICWTNARHRTKAGQKLGYHHWKPAPLIDNNHQSGNNKIPGVVLGNQAMP